MFRVLDNLIIFAHEHAHCRVEMTLLILLILTRLLQPCLHCCFIYSSTEAYLIHTFGTFFMGRTPIFSARACSEQPSASSTTSCKICLALLPLPWVFLFFYIDLIRDMVPGEVPTFQSLKVSTDWLAILFLSNCYLQIDVAFDIFHFQICLTFTMSTLHHYFC